MNGLHRLPPSEHRAALARPLPHLSLVRGPADSAAGQDADASRRLDSQAAASAGRLGSAWTQRSRVALAGEGASAARADWPGRAQGIRAPEQDETPLSAAEVTHAARIGLCSIPDATKPPQRVFVARGDWAIHSVGAALGLGGRFGLLVGKPQSAQFSQIGGVHRCCSFGFGWGW